MMLKPLPAPSAGWPEGAPAQEAHAAAEGRVRGYACPDGAPRQTRDYSNASPASMPRIH